MSTVGGMLAEYEPLSELPGSTIEQLAEFATLTQFEPGHRIFRTGEPADTLYVIRHGRVAIEVVTPTGGTHVLETLDRGEILGISWMLPPFRLAFDARCIDQCGAIAIDAAALRATCDAEPDFGYLIHKHLAKVIRDRLQAARLQLLDLYGSSSDTMSTGSNE